jgi:uncharacterized protein with HEPN domain
VTDDERTARRLDDLRRFADEAAFLVSHGRDRYLTDAPEGALLRNAAGHLLVKVATVVEKLPDDFRRSSPGIDWRAITRMRNLVAHHDDDVNDDLMFDTLAIHIPQLVTDLHLN